MQENNTFCIIKLSFFCSSGRRWGKVSNGVLDRVGRGRRAPAHRNNITNQFFVTIRKSLTIYLEIKSYLLQNCLAFEVCHLKNWNMECCSRSLLLSSRSSCSDANGLGRNGDEGKTVSEEAPAEQKALADRSEAMEHRWIHFLISLQVNILKEKIYYDITPKWNLEALVAQ